jgi:hypothetical protein
MDDPQKQLDAARQREAILRKAIHDIIKLAPAEAPVDDVEPFIEMKYADDGVRAAYRHAKIVRTHTICANLQQALAAADAVQE